MQSAKASQNGQVAVQALKLRRAFATGLWNCENGVLGQFSSLDTSTVTALRFNGIATFEDVMSSSEEQIEKVAKRMAPFGKNLRRVVQQTLSGAMDVTAEIEYAIGSTMPSDLICRVVQRNRNQGLELPSTAVDGDSNVAYTLIAYCDRSNGCLLYKQKINRSSMHQVPVPEKFGKISVHLISSMVGLDGKSMFMVVRRNILPFLTSAFSTSRASRKPA